LIVTGGQAEIIGSFAGSSAKRDGTCVGNPADQGEPARGAGREIIDFSMNAIQDECRGSLYVIRRDWN